MRKYEVRKFDVPLLTPTQFYNREENIRCVLVQLQYALTSGVAEIKITRDIYYDRRVIGPVLDHVHEYGWYLRQEERVNDEGLEEFWLVLETTDHYGDDYDR